MRDRYGEGLIEAPSLPEPEVVKVRVVLIHGASGRCEQMTEDADYALVLVDRKYRDKLLSELGRKVAVKMTGVKEQLEEEPSKSLQLLLAPHLLRPLSDFLPLNFEPSNEDRS